MDFENRENFHFMTTLKGFVIVACGLFEQRFISNVFRISVSFLAVASLCSSQNKQTNFWGHIRTNPRLWVMTEHLECASARPRPVYLHLSSGHTYFPRTTAEIGHTSAPVGVTGHENISVHLCESYHLGNRVSGFRLTDSSLFELFKSVCLRALYLFCGKGWS